MTVSSCLFCRIVDGDEPADVLYASDTVMAFRDVAPQAPVHVQVIPKEHLASAAEVEDRHAGMLADLFHAARQVARAEGLEDRGWRLVANIGPEGGQHIYHLHLHLLGGRQMTWPPG
ncbi:MAG TPA: HIT domain-containing protein [Actinomycetota bacterium]|nr:HIT domain-containing protein [Actinomycetota bacterium]